MMLGRLGCLAGECERLLSTFDVFQTIREGNNKLGKGNGKEGV